MITLATCSLNQWALDFQGNLSRSIESFRIAKEKGACYRLGPELELSGYGANDHFLENDTILHCFEVLIELMKAPECLDIIGDVGMPILHNGVRYNCRVIFYNRKILLIRPKMFLAQDSNYREMRWFTPWNKQKVIETFTLPSFAQYQLNQKNAPIGDGVIKTPFCSFGTELCEELFTPSAPHIDLSLAGVEVITNGSASHHEFQKLHRRIELIREATLKGGGVYLYANQQGCDGERVYYDGSALIVVNGSVVAQSSQFSLNDVEVIAATVDISQIHSFRAGNMSRCFQASTIKCFPTIETDLMINFKAPKNLSKIINVQYLSPSEEIRYGPACWLWDYLRRSKQGGFFLPLSGGIDSCATALIVYSMCVLVYKEVSNGNEKVLLDLRNMVRNDTFIPTSPQDISNFIFHTCYMGTENSSENTKSRATRLAGQIGSYHLNITIDAIVTSILTLFHVVTGKSPRFQVHGGSATENLALQNVQARTRMVVSYLFAQLSLWSRGLSGSLLVLGSSNVDETLRGYLTKYDCSSADLNPIGGISKVDLRNFISHMSQMEGFASLKEFLDAPPTAELEPRTSDYEQTDEVDMGMTYEELSVFGTLRKVYKMGPYSMFKRLLNDWAPKISPQEIAEKVQRFFFYYGINRHKTTVLPPSYHMSAYSPDDNRFDLRPFLYAPWNWQFTKINRDLKNVDI